MAEILSVKTEKFEMEYAKFGDGPKTFIIIPGLSLKNVLNSASSVEVGYKIFKQDYTCYLFDRIKNPPEVYPISQMAEDLAETLKVLGIKDADVFGSSQGGMVAQYMAINHPELIRKLVLVLPLPVRNPASWNVSAAGPTWLLKAVPRNW